VDDEEGPRPDSTIDLAPAEPDQREIIRDQAASIARYKRMYDRASALAKIGIWECDLATGALTWTDGVYDLFELPRGSRLDREAIVALYDEESRGEMERLRTEAIRDGTSFVLDIKIRTAKGRERWLRLSADVEREDGRPARIFGTKQDITEEKKAQGKVLALQAELLQLSRRSAMDAMAATLAHELNQPLAAIANYVAGSRRMLGNCNGAVQGPELDESLEAIEQCALGAGKIIRSLRDMTGENSSGRRAVDANPLILQAASLATIGAPDSARLRYALTEGALAMADPVQIQQVFINLVRNAVEAVQGQPRRDVTIASSAQDGFLAITVEDSGTGIAPDMAERIFESFVTTKPDGMGVGLSVSRAIVEAHGGTIQAGNREGGGAAFEVRLPLAKGEAPAPPPGA
jgi:two-component system sensor kinase FixL